MRKGISTFVSATLLIAFVIALAAVFGPWANDLTSGLADDSEESAEGVLRGEEAGVDVVKEDFDRFSEEMDIQVKNSGSIELEGLKVDIMCKDGSVIREDLGGTLEKQEVLSKTLENEELVDCEPENIRVFSNDVEITREKVEDPVKRDYYVQVIGDTEDKINDFDTGYFLVDANADFEGEITGVEGMTNVSPAALVTNESGIFGVSSFGDGRVITDEYYWNTSILSGGKVEGEDFQTFNISDGEDLSGEPGIGRVSITGLSVDEGLEVESLAGNNVNVLNDTRVVFDDPNKTYVVDAGKKSGKLGDSDVIQELDLIDIGSGEKMLEGPMSRGSVRLEDNKIFRSGVAKVENSTGDTVIRSVQKIWNTETGTKIAEKKMETVTDNPDGYWMIDGAKVGDHLVVSNVDAAVLNESFEITGTNITVYDAGDGFNSIFSEDPANVYKGHEGIVASVDRMDENQVVTGEVADTDLVDNLLNLEAEVTGDAEVHVWEPASDQERQDAVNIYKSGLEEGALIVDSINDRKVSVLTLIINTEGSFDFERLERNVVDMSVASGNQEFVIKHEVDGLAPGLIPFDTF